MTSLRTGALALALPLAFAAMAPTPAAAQDVQYETVTRIDLPGALGTAVRVAARLGGGSTEVVETTYIKGRRMRSDADGTSTILDMEEGRVTLLDHQAKTYMSFTFEEAAQHVRQQLGNEQRTVSERGDAHRLNFRFAVDAANERQRVAGQNAERFFLTMLMEGEVTPEGATEREEAGSLVVLMDIWSSREGPAYQAIRAFHDAAAVRYAEAGSAIMQALAAAFADEPEMRVAFEQSAAEAQKMDGMALRTVTRFVAVAPGEEFDRELVLNPQQRRGPSVAQQAGRAALGRLGGRRAQQQAEEPAAADEPTHATIVTVTSEVRNIRTTSLDAQLFTVPQDYTRVSEP